MSTLLDANKDAPIYDAFYFRASPTFNDWAKLAARDVHGLRTTPEFESQGIYFHLNYPIKFVRLIATVIGIEQINRYILLTLDDHSGATIEAKITRLTPLDIVTRDAEADLSASNQRSALNCHSNSNTSITDIAEKIQAVTATGVRETNISNVEVASTLDFFDVLVDGTAIDIGSVVKAKCTLGRFRNEIQLQVKRLSVIRDTNEEVQAWADTTKYRQTVLSKPWQLSSGARKRVDEQVEKERRQEQEYLMKKADRERKKEEKKRRWEVKLREYEERDERTRREKERVLNKGALI